MSTANRTMQPEIDIKDQAPPRPRWYQLATSADHKDVGRILVGAALGSLFIAAVLFFLMRLQLLIPENGFLDPVTFNRLLSVYGEAAIFGFALPLVFGLFYYVVPLQIGARTTALPRLGQTGLWLYLAGAALMFASFMYTPSEAGVNPLPPLSEREFLANNGVDIWLTSVGLIILGMLFLSFDLITTLRNHRAPGMAWRRVPVFSWTAAASGWLMIVIGPIMLAAVTLLMLDRNADGVFFAGGGDGGPLLWQHLSWIFFTGAYVTILIAALGAIAEIFPTLSRNLLSGRPVVMASIAALAVLAPLAWMQNMPSAPVGSGWHYFGMIIALLMLIPLGMIFFNLIATLSTGAIHLRAPLLFAVGAVSMISIGLVAELTHSLTAVGALLGQTVDSTAATHYALGGAAVLGGFAALHYWYPKMSGMVLGETMGKFSFWAMFVGANVAFFPLFLAGIQGQVADAYKFFGGTGVTAYNVVASIGGLILVIGLILGLANVVVSLGNGRPARHDQWGGSTLEWYTLSPPPPHNFDVVPDVRSAQPLLDIRESIARKATADSKAAEQVDAPSSPQTVA